MVYYQDGRLPYYLTLYSDYFIAYLSDNYFIFYLKPYRIKL